MKYDRGYALCFYARLRTDDSGNVTVYVEIRPLVVRKNISTLLTCGLWSFKETYSHDTVQLDENENTEVLYQNWTLSVLQKRKINGDLSTHAPLVPFLSNI